MNNKKKIRVGYVIFVAILTLIITLLGILLTKNIGKSDDEVNSDKALTELSKMVKKINPEVSEEVRSAIEGNENATTYQELPDIESNEIVVQPTTDNYIEIYSSPEKSGNDKDGWLKELANKFNQQGGVTVNGVQYTIKLRTVSSGQAVDYIASKKGVPDAFTPSSDMWVSMLNSDGVKTTIISESLVENQAGMCISNKLYDEIKSEYGEVNLKNIVEATADGKMTTGYTNPFSSSAGLNLLVSILNEYGNGDIFSDEARNGFNKFQNKVPFVALTTVQMRNSADKGTFGAFVSEFQTYINDSTLSKNYKFVPYGYIHNNPLAAVTTDANKLEALKNFAAYCSTDEAKKLARDYGFENKNDYKCTYQELSGDKLREAQKFYKQNKDEQPVIAVFVTDTSGSMVGEPITALKNSLINAMQYINNDNYVGIVSYSSNVHIALPIRQFDLEQQSLFKGAVESLTPVGGTATYDGVAVALDMVEQQLQITPDAKAMIFVLSDGATNTGLKLDEIEPVIKGLKIPIYTIGYNDEKDEFKSSLKEVSNINEGVFIDADNDDIMYQIKMLFNSSL